MSQAALEVIKLEDLPSERPEECLSERLWAAVLYTDEMTRRVQVKDEVFALVKAQFSDQEVIELTTTVSFLYFSLLVVG